MILGVALVLVTLFAAIGLTRPWWGGASLTQGISRQSANIAAYRQRLLEIDQDLAAGALEPTAAASLKLELQQRLLEDAVPVDPPAERTALRWPALAIAAALPIFAGVWYYAAGSWRIQEQFQQQGGSAPHDAEAPAIEQMVEQLLERLKAQPDDADGWAMLARSYFVLERYPQSAEAYARANALIQPPVADLLVAEGAAVGLAADGDLAARPRQLFEAALNIDPNHTRALWFLGQAAAQAETWAEAQAYWERLLKQELPEDLRADLVARVKDLSQRTGRAPAIAPQAAVAPKTKTQPAPPAAAGPSLRVRIELAPAMASKQKPEQVLYVFVKAAEGPPMPLAAQKLHPDRWPMEVTLDDSKAMSPALRMSQFERWTVTARLGNEGAPTAQPGDLQGRISATRAESQQSVTIVINEQVQ